MRVQNMLSAKGNIIPNQFEIETEQGTYFQSYDSVICLIDRKGVIHLSPHWDYSRTTTKYLNLFLNTNSKELKRLIESGEIRLDIDIKGELIC